MNFAAITEVTRKRIEDYDVRTPSERVLAGTLSGGNQQKLVLARELGRDPELACRRPADTRTRRRGHRVRAPADTRERDRGKAVLLVSLELEEVQSLADRILVIYEGKIVREFVAGEATTRSSATT
jgi:general nucleoside transport system ATP-binding protein